jgi:hypothetical protein
VLFGLIGTGDFLQRVLELRGCHHINSICGLELFGTETLHTQQVLIVCLFRSTRVKRDSILIVGFNTSPLGAGIFYLYMLSLYSILRLID